MTNINRLKGQFLKGDIKLPKPKPSTCSYGSNISAYGHYKVNGAVFTKKGAL